MANPAPAPIYETAVERIESLANGEINILNRSPVDLYLARARACVRVFLKRGARARPFLHTRSPHYLAGPWPFLPWLSPGNFVIGAVRSDRQKAIGREVGGQFSYTCYTGPR